MAKAIVIGRSGQHEVNIDEKVYEKAHDAKCSVPQYLEREFGADVDAQAHGTVFNQLLAQNNMNLTRDPHTGLGSATLKDVMDGTISAATTIDGAPLSRILLPAAVLEMVEQNRAADHTSDVAAFEQMLAVDTTIAGSRFEQPVFDASNADGQELSRASQLAVPNIVGKLTVADRAGRIPTYTYGLEISDEAKKAMTIDQVAIYLSRMAANQAALLVDQHINGLVNGDKDTGFAALPTVGLTTFGATANDLTHTAYVRWLRAKRRTCTVSHLWCDEDTYDKIVNRKGRPTTNTLYVDSKELAAYEARPMNFGYTEPQIFIVNKGVIPAGIIVGLDSRFAIARIRNSEANYQATEQLVIRKGEQMRFDNGEIVYRQDDSAWTVLDLTK